MAKNKVQKKSSVAVEEADLDFFADEANLVGNEVLTEMMGNFVEASNEQIKMAVELTKLVVANNSNQTITEENVFATFKKASKVISESYPLKSLLEHTFNS